MTQSRAPSELVTGPPDLASGRGLSAKSGNDRLAWVDVAKGIGIILVVYGHAVRGFWGGKPWPAWTVIEDSVIYAFHMPLFFLIAGLFLWQSIGRGRLLFVRSRWWAVIYPYLLWSLVCGGIEVAAARFANTPMTVGDLLLIPFSPIEQFWFLYALLIVQLVATLCFPSKTVLFLAACLGIAFVILSGGITIIHVALRFLPFTAIGVCGAESIKRLSKAGPTAHIAILITSWTAFAVFYVARTTQPGSTIVLGCVGSVGCIAAALLFARSPAARPLAVLGQASMAIYVLHTLFSAGVRAGFVVLHVDRYALWTLIPEFAAGLLMPLLVWRRSVAHPKGYLMGFGTGPAKNSGPRDVGFTEALAPLNR